MRLGLVIVLLLGMLLYGEEKRGFNLKLNVQGAQVRELSIGCKDGCSVNYDEEDDIYVPVMSMGTGIIGLIPQYASPHLLYQDMRGIEHPQKWEIKCKPLSGKTIILSWQLENLPPNTTFQFFEKDRPVIDMSKFKSYTISKETTVTIVLK